MFHIPNFFICNLEEAENNAFLSFHEFVENRKKSEQAKMDASLSKS